MSDASVTSLVLRKNAVRIFRGGTSWPKLAHTMSKCTVIHVVWRASVEDHDDEDKRESKVPSKVFAGHTDLLPDGSLSLSLANWGWVHPDEERLVFSSGKPG